MKNTRSRSKGPSVPLIFRIFWLLIVIAFSNFVWLVFLRENGKKYPSLLSSHQMKSIPFSSAEKLYSTKRNGTTASANHVTGVSTSRRIRQELPSFENGGVVLFHHLAKTGGITIRKNFGRMKDGILVRRSSDIIGLRGNAIPLVTEILGGGTSKFKHKVLFLELHGDVPGLMELDSEIQQWRQRSAAHNMSFFTFSLLREPISFHLSCFNFFNIPPCADSWCLKQYPNATESDFLEALQPNNQCLHFVRFRRHGDPPPTLEECHSAYDWILKNMDWVGTTEELNSVTIPLLSHMLLGHESKIINTTTGEITAHNVQTKPDRFQQSDLSEGAIQFVQNASAGDRLLYEQLSRDYVLEPGFIVSRPDPFE